MKRMISVICLSAMMFFASALNVNATISDMSSYPLSGDLKTKLINYIDLEVVLDDNYKYKLKRFDVDEEGNYALGFGSSGDRSYVYVYNKDNEFLYGFVFHTYGTYGIELCNEGLTIFLDRENVLLTFDKNGTCIEGRGIIINTAEHNTQITNFLNKTTEEINGQQYSMERNVNIGESYSRFVLTDATGERTVLYGDAPGETNGHANEVFLIVMGILFLIVVAILAIKTHSEKEDESSD